MFHAVCAKQTDGNSGPAQGTRQNGRVHQANLELHQKHASAQEDSQQMEVTAREITVLALCCGADTRKSGLDILSMG